MTILQRRLASSPEAIHQSLKRRRERLEKRLDEVHNDGSGRSLETAETVITNFDSDYLDDLDDAPAKEVDYVEEQILDSATTALTIAELQAEIKTLKELETMAYEVRQSGTDRKWEELASIIQEDVAHRPDTRRSDAARRDEAAHQDDVVKMTDATGQRLKLVIFTEHLDTLRYLKERIITLFGRAFDDQL